MARHGPAFECGNGREKLHYHDRFHDCRCHARLAAAGPIQWPCPEAETAETSSKKYNKRLYTDLKFATANLRANFAAFHAKGLAEPPDPEYPFVLTTGRLYGHWHTQTRTGRIDKIRNLHPNPFLEVNPRDAQRLEIQSGEWIEVRSRRGFVQLPVLVTQNIAQGVVFMPMHWGALWADQAEVNALTHPEVCPISLEPELKACAVQIIPMPVKHPEANEISQQFSSKTLRQPTESTILTALPPG